MITLNGKNTCHRLHALLTYPDLHVKHESSNNSTLQGSWLILTLILWWKKTPMPPGFPCPSFKQMPSWEKGQVCEINEEFKICTSSSTFCCATTKPSYYKKHPTFSACEHLLVWLTTPHLGLIQEIILLYSHGHSYQKLLLPVLPLDSRVQTSTEIPSFWTIAADDVNPLNALEYPDSTSSMHPTPDKFMSNHWSPIQQTNQTLKNKEEEIADFKNGIKVSLTTLTDRSTKTLCRLAACKAVTSSREQIVAAAAITEGWYTRNIVSAHIQEHRSQCYNANKNLKLPVLVICMTFTTMEYGTQNNNVDNNG